MTANGVILGIMAPTTAKDTTQIYDLNEILELRFVTN